MDEVWLIRIATGDGEIGPVNLLGGTDRGETAAEAPQSPKELGSQPNLIAKDLDKSSPAQPALFGQQADGGRPARASQAHKCVSDGRMWLLLSVEAAIQAGGCGY